MHKSQPILCDQCGTSFHRPPSNRAGTGRANYCSRKCMSEAFTGRCSPKKGVGVTRPCAACKKPINRPSWWAKQNPRFFCNRKCFARWKAANWKGAGNPAWTGGKEYYYGPNWTRQSRRARARDNKECQLCRVQNGHRRNLDVHHIKPFKLFGLENYRAANRLTNLITLCPNCHCFLEKLCPEGTIFDWPTLKAMGLSRPRCRRRKNHSGRNETPLGSESPP